MNPSEQLYSRPDIIREERPIRLGSLLFTMVEPRPGHAAAYNRWYERDHFYSGCMIGEYTLAGGRYVAPKALKAKRYGSGEKAIDPGKGSYLALYWILDDHHPDWDRWAVKQVKQLHADGRMFTQRDHIHTGFYRYEAEYNAQGSVTPIELALDRPYPGIAAFIIELAPGKTAADVNAWLETGCPGDVALLASPLPLDPTRPPDVPTSEGNHVVLISFLNEDPLTLWDEQFSGLGARIAEAGLGEVSFASPFIPTIPGTDTHTDDL